VTTTEFSIEMPHSCVAISCLRERKARRSLASVADRPGTPTSLTQPALHSPLTITMAPVEGRREVPDSEDEPMTSSPVNVSDGIADKLFAMAHVPNQDAEDAPQEATRRHQATPETVANVTAERIDGLDADRNIASFNVNAPRDEQTDVQHTTTTASPKSTGEASDNAANLRLADAASYPRSATNDLNPRQDALIADTMQKSQQIAASGPTAELEATTASGTRPLLEDSVVTVRDGIKMAEEQYELANDEVVCGNAREQSSPQPMNASNASNEPKEELVRGRLQADNSKHTPSNGAEVSEIRPDEYSTSQARLSTLVTSQADTPTLSSQTSRTECVTSAESRDHGDNVDDTTQQIPKDGIPRLNCGISGGELDVKHAVCSLYTFVSVSHAYGLVRSSPVTCMTTLELLLLGRIRTLQTR
jgi:hypothetical protein